MLLYMGGSSGLKALKTRASKPRGGRSSKPFSTTSAFRTPVASTAFLKKPTLLPDRSTRLNRTSGKWMAKGKPGKPAPLPRSATSMPASKPK